MDLGEDDVEFFDKVFDEMYVIDSVGGDDGVVVYVGLDVY